MEPHRFASALAEPVGDALGGVWEGAHQDLLRHRAGLRNLRLARALRATHLRRHGVSPVVARVVLREERRDDLFVRHLRAAYAEGRHPRELAVADVEQRELDEVALAVEPEHVARAALDRDHPLLLTHLGDRVELVAVHGGELEAHRGGRLAHALLELARELVVAPLQEERHGAHLLRVERAVHLEHARRRAALDLVLEARPAPRAEVGVGARAELEVFVDEVERAPRGGGRMVRPEVARAVGGGGAHDGEPGPLGARLEPERGVLLVVAQLDVEARPMLLDEEVLEDRRLLLGLRDQGLEVGHHAVQQGHEVARVRGARMEVRPHAGAEALRLAHVDDDAALVLEQVDPGRRRQGRELVLDLTRQHTPRLVRGPRGRNRDFSDRSKLTARPTSRWTGGSVLDVDRRPVRHPRGERDDLVVVERDAARCPVEGGASWEWPGFRVRLQGAAPVAPRALSPVGQSTASGCLSGWAAFTNASSPAASAARTTRAMGPRSTPCRRAAYT